MINNPHCHRQTRSLWNRSACSQATISTLQVRTLFVLFALITLLSSTRVNAGTVRTLDGKNHTGQVTLDASGKLSVVETGKTSPILVELSNVLYAALKEDKAAEAPTSSLEAPAIVRTEGGKLPPGWEAAAIGAVAQPVSAKYTEGVFSIKSGNAELTANARRDVFCFVKSDARGDVEIIARLMDVKDAGRVSAGLLARNGDAPDSPYVGVIYTDGAARFLKRTKTGERATAGASKSAIPIWLRLVRQASTITAYTSADGKSWDELGSETLPAGDGASIGLAVAGRNESIGAHFDSVRATPLLKIDAPVTPLAPTTYRRGLVLRSGTTLVQTEIESATDAGIKFSKGERRDIRVSLAQVARIFFRDTAPDALARIPTGQPGILLKNGDFMEGTLRAIRDGRIELSSVLFGLQKIEPGNSPYVLVVNDIEVPKAELIVRTAEGSVYFAKSVRMEKDRLVVEDASAGEFTLPRSTVTHIAAGPGKLEPLGNLKPQHVDSPAGQTPGLSVNSTGLGVPMALAGKPVAMGLTLAAGTSATWDLSGKYKMLTFRAGVPTGVAPTAAMRFIVTGDGKELYRSTARLSTDAPVMGAVDVKGIKSLTLKVEAGTPEMARLATPGLFGEAALAK